MHVLILVVSKDSSAALIIFAVYLVMLYVAKQTATLCTCRTDCRKWGIGVGHINYLTTSVCVYWYGKNPFTVYNEGGYQVAQSLMAIGTVGKLVWNGTFRRRQIRYLLQSQISFFGNCGGNGTDFALGLILVCVSVYMMFLNIAMQLRDSFINWWHWDLEPVIFFQIFLTIGGVTKFIPIYRSDTSAGKPVEPPSSVRSLCLRSFRDCMY